MIQIFFFTDTATTKIYTISLHDDLPIYCPQQVNRFKDFTPQEMAELQTKRLTLALDLTPAQQKKVQALQLQNAQIRKAKMDARQARKKDGTGPKLNKEQRLANMNARLDRQIEMKQQMKQILSAEQFEKWQDLKRQRKPRIPGKPRGRNM